MRFLLSKISIITAIVLGMSFGFAPHNTFAADPKHVISDPAYAAKYVSQSAPDPVEIETGTTKTVIFKFKNVGTATWNGASSHFLSAYTVEPRYRASVFEAPSWIASRETAKLEGIVKPNEVGELKLELKAPGKIGEYTEEFYLASENNSWVKGGYFFIKIKVVAKKQTTSPVKVESVVTSTQTSTVNSSLYQAKRVILNKKQIEARGGEEVPVILAFQNIGSNSWNSYSIKTSVKETGTGSRMLVEKTADLPQWAVARETVNVKVPNTKGTYTLAVKLAANGVEIPEELGTISVNVTENAGTIDDTEETIENNIREVIPRLASEPKIRIGIWKDPADGVKFVSNDDDYYVYDGTTMVGQLARGTSANMTYSGGVYYFVGGGITVNSGTYLRLEPVNNVHAVFRLTNYSRLVSWKGPKNFNAYRGAMEYRTTKSNEGIYVIEETMFEDYVAGIAETSDASPIEYIKALLTAARTYAYSIQNSSSKHDSRFFDVVATTGDQLYLGYESEVMMPHVAEAARATRGYMVTYDIDTNPVTPNDVVITPYFANTDGKTKSWTQVWGGVSKPWLVSVIAEFDKRDKKKLSGHGVGMSARDAAIRADELKESFDTILKYYYTGVAVEKMYN